jgi:hypothetical protein
MGHLGTIIVHIYYHCSLIHLHPSPSIFTLWWSCYVRWWWDRYQLSSAYCQVHVGDNGCVLSCLALNSIIIRGLWLLGHLPCIRDPQACAELGHNNELDQANRWQDLAHPRPVRWDKRTGTGRARFSSFKLVVPPLQPGELGPYLVWVTWFPNHLTLEVPGVQDPDILVAMLHIMWIPRHILSCNATHYVDSRREWCCNWCIGSIETSCQNHSSCILYVDLLKLVVEIIPAVYCM